MSEYLPDLIFVAGICQLGVLIASALVPLRLNWKQDLQGLPKLHQQLFWVYGGYIVLSILALGTISLVNSRELATGGWLARSFCAYVAVFWGIRLSLQTVLEARPFLTTWWLNVGYHTLTVLFIFFTLVFGWAAFRP